ncbi:MAG TPA: ABC transporter permease [Chitinophagaceae bacterium]|nr:ABC transporter permease [Chitinophagaceae bacterium]
MNKIGLVIQREYLTRVRKKSFLITTLLVPMVIIGFYAAIIAISISDQSDKALVAVIDEGNLLDSQSVNQAQGNLSLRLIPRQPEARFQAEYKSQGYTYFLYIPPLDLSHPQGINLHSQSAVSLATKSRIEKLINEAIESRRLQQAHIPSDQYQAIRSDISIANPLDSGRTSEAGVAYAVSFACGLLIYMVLMIYGTMVMRGVMEEKMNRIAEVIVSSVKPFQLMLGKIIGIGLVGLTQFGIWIILLIAIQFMLPLIFPSLAHQVGQTAGTGSAIQTITLGLKSLPIGLILFCFLFYFLGGYLLYASLFAAIGSVISEDQQEAQQLVFPVMMPILLSFVIMTKAVSDPNSGLALFGSLFPLTSPIVMMGRITYDVPAWQLISSMFLLVLGFLFFTWLTAKIYRTGILLYGKKVTWKEMIRWVYRKA